MGKLQQASFSDADNALSEIDELIQRFRNRLTLGNLALAKRYIEGHLNLLVEASWASIDFDIVFYRADPSELVRNASGHAEGSASWAGIAKTNGSIGPQKNTPQSNLSRNLDDCRRYRHDGIVLINDVEPMNHPKEVIGTIVCFKPNNEPLGFGADAIYFGYTSGFKAFGPVPDWRKPTSSIRLLTVGANKIADQVVERTPEIVNRVSQRPAKFNWDGFLDEHAQDILAGLRIIVNDELVRLGVVESLSRNLKISNVAFGPFNF